MIVVVKLLQTRRGIRESNASAAFHLPVVGKTGAVVVNSQTQVTVCNRRTDPDQTCVGTARDTVSQRVLRERLKNQIRNERFRGRRIDVELDFEPIGESHLRSEEHTSELQSRLHLVCRLLLE